MEFSEKPSLVAIEKKSTGVSLISYLKELRGIRLMEIERNVSSGSKVNRFINAQYYVSSRILSFTNGSEHADKCIEHMTSITDNNSHANDDICDTCVDAIKIGIIDDFFSLKSLKDNRFDNLIKKNLYAHKEYMAGLNKLWKI
jgi:hypothetical protein